MTIKNFRTHWPLDMRFTKRDIHSGEQSLENEEPFYEHGLRLLYNVRLSDLSQDANAGKQQHQTLSGVFDYLICKGDAVLMAIRLTNRAPWYGKFLYVPDLPVAEISSNEFAQGNIENILTVLDTVLHGTAPPVWYCHLQYCPSELIEPMQNKMLLETLASGDIVPTEYGMCSGLVRVSQYGRLFSMCSQQTAQSLPTLLDAEELRDIPQRDRIPFDELLQAYRCGLSCNGQTSAELVRDIMDMPLTEYMDGFPTELARLQSEFPEQCDTYGDAARNIYRLLHAPNNDQYLLGVSLMRDLSQPPLEDKKIREAMQMGRRVVGREPDWLPERYQKIYTNREIRSFSDCIDSVRKKLPASTRLAFTPLASFFQGVSLLSQSRYPRWLSDALQSYLCLSGRCQYADLLSLADYKMQEEDNWSICLSIRLLYLLLIEPYCLIQENNSSKEKEI